VNQFKVTMFSGKGGVGKTTCAAATALHYAGKGRKTLAISTDATPSLLHIFKHKNGHKPAKIRNSLYVSELGLSEVAAMWDEKFGRDVYDVFSTFVAIDYQAFVEFTTSILPGLRDEFMVDYIKELTCSHTYDSIIWDTAPLGQTLALLQTPSMLLDHLRMAPRIYSRLKLSHVNKEPVFSIIRRWEKLSAEDVDFLRNDVEFIIVTIPEALAVTQLKDIFGQMNRYGLSVNKLVINNVVKEIDSTFLQTKAEQQQRYLNQIYTSYPGLEIVELPWFSREVTGEDRLGEVEKILFSVDLNGAGFQSTSG